ncbi:CAP domain-containing protein [Ruegeria arenilitoris]|uniref:CAP domain-containing protein n=1 Tax=Ruegeria arenilitoris TaxID=1173585 RepID=UPI00147E3CB7|nr:CAP domain-containing protein [Ruegeria arenilitoris]
MSEASSLEREMLNLINSERVSRGLDPVQLELRLNAAAEEHSDWMLETGTFSHTGEGDSSATQRIRESGFVLSGSWSTAENIAWQSQRGVPGFSDDVVNLHDSLMNSDGHRANILNPALAYIGIGIEIGTFQGVPAVMVTQNFARTSAGVQLDEGGNAGTDDSLPSEQAIAPEENAEVEATPTLEQFTLESESGALRGTPEELDNDVITNFDEGNQLILEGVQPGRSNIQFNRDSEIEVDLDGDGNSDVTISLISGRSEGDIFAIAVDGNTIISYAKYLPDLSDGDRVSRDQINGVVNKEFLSGDGATDFQVELLDIGHAGYNNVLGVYDILDNGEIANVRLLYDNTNRDTGSVTISDVADGSRLGFFVVQNAADWAADVSNSDVLEFRAGNGAVADVDDDFDLILFVNGNSASVNTFHAEKALLNTDDEQHALSGIADGGNAMIIGFEDLTGGGDQDFEDVVFSVTRIETDALSIA